ncbi:MAG: rRNA maturation RNase YbeY [Defluviitaleaceae bacterium]|nr:rRNA maturation RNase YbeY [Defluviitaleaceae bacterium]
MLDIEIINESGAGLPQGCEQSVIKAIEGCAEAEGVKGQAEVCVSIVTNEAIRELNAQFRGIDAETDVLSFPQYEPGEKPEQGMPAAYGDIVISLEKAVAQAEEYGHGVEREMGFLAAHGMLHLLGYDHATPEEEKVMFQKQEEILTKAGLPR